MHSLFLLKSYLKDNMKKNSNYLNASVSFTLSRAKGNIILKKYVLRRYLVNVFKITSKVNKE